MPKVKRNDLEGLGFRPLFGGDYRRDLQSTKDVALVVHTAGSAFSTVAVEGVSIYDENRKSDAVKLGYSQIANDFEDYKIIQIGLPEAVTSELRDSLRKLNSHLKR